MKTDSAARPNLLQQIGNLLTGPTSQTEPENTSSTIPGVEVEVSETPNSFEDYAAEGDEPADMALTDLVPVELAAFNLPQSSAIKSSELALKTSDRYTAPVPATTIEPQSKPAVAISSAEASELADDLLPLELTQLNLQLKTSKTKEPKANCVPLPDLSSLTRAAAKANAATKATTVRVPAQHIDQLNTIIQDLLDHQARQSRHNEQLGVLVKQLLGQMAGQQKKGDRTDYSAVQKAVQDALASAAN